MANNFVESGIESEDPNMLANQIYESIKSDPEIASFPREDVMQKLVRKVQDRQAKKGFQFGAIDTPEAKQARREDALAKAAAGRAEIERDFNPDGSEKFNFGNAFEGFKQSVTMGAYPTIAGAAAAAGGAYEDGSFENVKSNYLSGRDETIAGLNKANQSPSYILGDTAGSIAPMAVPAAGAMSKAGLGAKVAMGTATGATAGALRTDLKQKAGEFQSGTQTGINAGLGGVIGGAGAGAAHGLGKANAWLREKDSFMGLRPLVDAYDEAGSFKQLIIDKLKSNPPMEKSLQSVVNHGSPTMSRSDASYTPKPRQGSYEQPNVKFDTPSARSQADEIGEVLQPTQPMSFKDLQGYERQRQAQMMRELQMQDLNTRGSLQKQNDDLMEQMMSQRQAPVPQSFDVPQPTEAPIMRLDELKQAAKEWTSKVPYNHPKQRKPMAGTDVFDPFPEPEWIPPKEPYKNLEQRLAEFQSRKKRQ
jgi:hypothetical protein